MDAQAPEDLGAATATGMPLPDRTGSVLGVSKRGFHRIAYTEWGDPRSQRVVVCVHGLTRQGRDFDPLAAALARLGWRVVCPDLPGRGQSDRLRDHEDYVLPQYAMDLTALIARLGVDGVDWIGTSLGGLVGIVVAGQPGTPVRRLVVNDIGPFLPWQALHRIALNVVKTPAAFPDFQAVVEHTRRTLAPFGSLSDAEWEHLARHGAEQLPDGRWHLLSDPGIAAAFRPAFFFNLSLWTYWDAIRCPTLVLRGETSDLLLPSTLAEMARRGPRADTVEIPGCGHAPALLDPEQIGIVTGWLQACPA